MKKHHYVEMNIDEMKEVKETWQIHLRLFARKIRKVKNIEETTENRYELKELEMNYTYCVNIISEIISIYKELIDLAENCDLDEDYFKKQIETVKRLHANFRIEANKKKYKISSRKILF